VCVFLWFGWLYQFNRLYRKTPVQNDLLCVVQDVKLYSLSTTVDPVNTVQNGVEFCATVCVRFSSDAVPYQHASNDTDGSVHADDKHKICTNGRAVHCQQDHGEPTVLRGMYLLIGVTSLRRSACISCVFCRNAETKCSISRVTSGTVFIWVGVYC